MELKQRIEFLDQRVYLDTQTALACWALKWYMDNFFHSRVNNKDMGWGIFHGLLLPLRQVFVARVLVVKKVLVELFLVATNADNKLDVSK